MITMYFHDLVVYLMIGAEGRAITVDSKQPLLALFETNPETKQEFEQNILHPYFPNKSIDDFIANGCTAMLRVEI